MIGFCQPLAIQNEESMTESDEIVKQLQNALQRISALEKRMDILDPPPTPFMESLEHDASRIVKLRIDLFKNASKKGVPPWNFKVFVWLDDKKGARGNVIPFHFHARTAGWSEIKPGDTSKYATSVQLLKQHQANNIVIGHVVHKGKHVKGTVYRKDHVITQFTDDDMILNIGSWRINVPASSLVPIKSTEKTPPVKRWYWNRP